MNNKNEGFNYNESQNKDSKNVNMNENDIKKIKTNTNDLIENNVGSNSKIDIIKIKNNLTKDNFSSESLKKKFIETVDSIFDINLNKTKKNIVKDNSLTNQNKLISKESNIMVNYTNNKTIEKLISEGKFDFKNASYEKFSDIEINPSTYENNQNNANINNEEILKIDLGNLYIKDKSNIKISKDNIDADLNKLNIVDKEFEYKAYLIGREIKVDENDYSDINSKSSFTKIDSDNNLANDKNEIENKNLQERDYNDSSLQNIKSENYLTNKIFINEKENKSIIDNITKIEENKSIFYNILSNPFAIILLIIFGYIIYPNIWIKDKYLNLSLMKNNSKCYKSILQFEQNMIENQNKIDFILENEPNKELLNYIQYRKTLYMNLRSNFK